MIQSIRAGLTLIEITIALAIFGTIASIAGESMISGTRMNTEVALSAELTDDTNRVLQKIAGQLRSADYTWIYVNNGAVSTTTFKVCTGLGVDASGEIGPQFDHSYTLAFDSISGVLTATLVEGSTNKVLNQEVARNLRTPDGFRMGQLGLDTLVKGNQLQLTMARKASLGHGTDIVREASTTIFLRSSIYANTNLTTSATSVTTPTTPTTPEASHPVPIVILGVDQDLARSSGNNQNAIQNVNCLLILGSVQMPGGSTATIDTSSFTISMSQQNGSDASITVKRGWINSENTGNNKINQNEFRITGWVKGPLTVSAAVSSTAKISGGVTSFYNN